MASIEVTTDEVSALAMACQGLNATAHLRTLLAKLSPLVERALPLQILPGNDACVVVQREHEV